MKLNKNWMRRCRKTVLKQKALLNWSNRIIKNIFISNVADNTPQEHYSSTLKILNYRVWSTTTIQKLKKKRWLQILPWMVGLTLGQFSKTKKFALYKAKIFKKKAAKAAKAKLKRKKALVIIKYRGKSKKTASESFGSLYLTKRTDNLKKVEKKLFRVRS